MWTAEAGYLARKIRIWPPLSDDLKDALVEIAAALTEYVANEFAQLAVSDTYLASKAIMVSPPSSLMNWLLSRSSNRAEALQLILFSESPDMYSREL